MANPVRVGILGLGTVGCGVVEVLQRNAGEILRRTGRGIELVAAAVRSPDKARPVQTGGMRISSDASSLVRDSTLDIIVETIGGTDIARRLTLDAIASGKHVVTANKALIARCGNEIFRAAGGKGVIVRFEAAVAGGIPIIKTIRESLSANRIEWLAGIINGTSNFILSEMRDSGRVFDDALAKAQSLGYAEADPEHDVNGVDAAHKLTILASIAFGIPLQPDWIITRGIQGISSRDISYADELGYRIKHLGVARRTDDSIELWVQPALIPEKRLLANVDGVMNAVVVAGNAVGPTLYYGAGAGAGPTASSVVADLIDTVREMEVSDEARVPSLGFRPEALVDMHVSEAGEMVSAHYLRLTVREQVGVLSKITQALANHGVSIETVLQKGEGAGADSVPVALLTHRVRESDLGAALEEIEGFDEVTAATIRFRVETLD